MRRDPDVMRSILLDVEGEARRIVREPGLTNGRALIDSGHARGSAIEGRPGTAFVHLTALTWRGQELLETIRTEAQWAAVKARVGEQSAPFQLLEAIAFELAADAAGLRVERRDGSDQDGHDAAAITTASGAVERSSERHGTER